jgi:hypothetical protein
MRVWWLWGQSPFLNGNNIVGKALEYRNKLGHSSSNVGEFAAFIAYAQVRPLSPPNPYEV